MRVSELWRFLLGDRRAILGFASEPRTLWLALVFVFSAALARRYDGADLVAEPHALFLPALVSWFNATLLFLLLHLLVGRRADPRPGFIASYRVVLGLFWLTAPLAWLYAIPVERFFEPYGATVANLWLLLVVATWRVVLMARVVSVIYGIGGWTGFFQVMFFADLVAVGIMIASPKPIVQLMAGITHTDRDALLLEVSFSVIYVGILSLPVWAILMLVSAFKNRGAWDLALERSPRGIRGLWLLASFSILVWLPILPFTQAEQRLGRHIDESLAAHRIGEALDLMSTHARDEFPPGYDPRPHQWPGRTEPDVLDVVPQLAEREVPGWVREAFLAKLDRRLRDARQLDPAKAAELDALRGRIEGLEAILERHAEVVEPALEGR
ncbi:MAG: hypothetical protein MPN21_24160 [Thermoanaerobaculia bacterium]|nr:hypothetical protein [Thermoanaerobaculia bacterium]